MEIKINEQIFEIDENSLIAETEASCDTDSENELLVVSFSGALVGEEQIDLLSSMLKGLFDFEIPEKNIAIKAKQVNLSYSYQDSLSNDTAVRFKVIIKQYDEAEEDSSSGWDALGKQIGRMISETICNWIRTRSISELLVEKGIITQEEYEDKLRTLMARDYEDMKNFLLDGIEMPLPKHNGEETDD